MEEAIKAKEQAVHVIYASNDGYAGHLAASLCSLLDNNRYIKNLDVYVLSAQMCEAFQKMTEGSGSRLWPSVVYSGTRRSEKKDFLIK